MVCFKMYLKTSNQEKLNLGIGQYQCNWGIHIAGLYENVAERDEIVMGFLHAGEVNGDLQFYAPAERSMDNFKQAYCHNHPDSCQHLENPEIFQLSTPQSLYYPEGVFSPWTMDENLNRFYRQSQKKGLRNVRATAEMTWALEAVPGTEHLMAYESRLNYFIPGKPWISICLYNITKFDGATIMNVLRTHPYTLNGGVITENPYYQDPDVWLSENSPQFLNH